MPDTFNRFAIGVREHRFVFMRPPVGKLSKEDAHNIAAWLIALSVETEEDKKVFAELLKAVRET